MESKAQIIEKEESEFAKRTIPVVLVFAVAYLVWSVYVLRGITGNLYTSLYFTVSTLLDAAGFIPQMGYVAIHSSTFYLFFLVLFFDGIAKIIIVGFLVASLIQLISSIDIGSKFKSYKIKRLKDHAIICGYTNFSDRLMLDLKAKGKEFVVIEKNPVKVDMLRDLNYPVLDGDFTKEGYLSMASIKTASAIVFDTDSDFENLLGIITAKKMNKDLKAIVKVVHEDSVMKMVRGGANVCILPEALSGIEIGERLVRKVKG
ncbi:TrkA-N domain protein [mine drainage metagenome]|uniref:TrkA-N domain protein n=2 Tax=mine drainage metagenome TaxID=410659 RepID=T0ZR48_9ZZZZ